VHSEYVAGVARGDLRLCDCRWPGTRQARRAARFGLPGGRHGDSALAAGASYLAGLMLGFPELAGGLSHVSSAISPSPPGQCGAQAGLHLKPCALQVGRCRRTPPLVETGGSINQPTPEGNRALRRFDPKPYKSSGSPVVAPGVDKGVGRRRRGLAPQRGDAGSLSSPA